MQVSAIERPLRREGATEILDYTDKYVPGEGMAAAARELPAAVPDVLRDQVLAVAARVAELSSARGVLRVDFLQGDAGLFVNEINTIPGSLSRYLFIDPPVAFLALLDDLVAEAVARPSHSYVTAGAEGTVLRAAGAIAAKLA